MLLPEFLHNVQCREDGLSCNAHISSLPHLFLKHHILAVMLCTQSIVLLFYLHICSDFTISNKNLYSLLGRILFLVLVLAVSCCNLGTITVLYTAAMWFSAGVLSIVFDSESCKQPVTFLQEMVALLLLVN